MFTNREEVLENAFRVFLKMNYERASITEIAKACGLSRAGLVYYYPYKLELFMAVADRYLFQVHKPEEKFGDIESCTLHEFIGRYVEGVRTTMEHIVNIVKSNDNPGNICPNFYYYHFLEQVKIYYPNVQERVQAFFTQQKQMWTSIITRARDNGEIRADVNIEDTVSLFYYVYIGMGYEQSYINGLDVEEMERYFRHIYSLIKA